MYIDCICFIYWILKYVKIFNDQNKFFFFFYFYVTSLCQSESIFLLNIYFHKMNVPIYKFAIFLIYLWCHKRNPTRTCSTYINPKVQVCVIYTVKIPLQIFIAKLEYILHLFYYIILTYINRQHSHSCNKHYTLKYFKLKNMYKLISLPPLLPIFIRQENKINYLHKHQFK